MPSVTPLPPQEVLCSLLSYDPATGALVWMKRSSGIEWQARRWNTRWAGKPALSSRDNSSGYLRGTINDRHFLAHRVIWKMVTGRDPGEIDHIDGDRANNRWSNLREVTRRENCRNRGLRHDNISGHAGITRESRGGLWRVSVCDQFLGNYDKLEMAVAVRKRFEREAGFHANHGARQGFRR